MRYFDPHSMLIFIAICEEKSIALAAKRVSLVPSAVSKRITALEDQTGVKLLERNRLRMTPTPAGEMLLRYARETLASMEKTHAELGEFTQGVQGNIKILASTSAVYQFLPEEVAEFSRQHYRVKVSIHESVSSQIVRGIREGHADIGILSDATSTNGLACHPYHKDQLVIVSHHSHPLKNVDSILFEETLDYEYINIIPGSIVDLTMQREAAALGKTMHYRVQVSTIDAACRIVAAGLAIAIIPQRVANLHEKLLNIKVTLLENDWGKRRFVMCTKSHQHLTPSARILLDHLQKNVTKMASS